MMAKSELLLLHRPSQHLYAMRYRGATTQERSLQAILQAASAQNALGCQIVTLGQFTQASRKKLVDRLAPVELICLAPWDMQANPHTLAGLETTAHQILFLLPSPPPLTAYDLLDS